MQMISICPLLIHNPHSATWIPPEYQEDFLLSDAELQAELLRMTDRYIDELFEIPGVQVHQNRVSRLVMDPERFRSDEDEPMSKKGMGLAYTHTSQGKLMRILSPDAREKILADLYDPYHADLARKVDEILDQTGSCLILDAHSFPSIALPYEAGLAAERPDICIGYEPYHMSEELLKRTEEFFRSHQLTVARNWPFAGSLVPMKYFRKDRRVLSIMIELNRRLYMDEATGEKLDSFEEVRRLVVDYIEMLVQ